MILASLPTRRGFVAILGVVCLGLISLILAAVLALTVREARQVQNEERRAQAAWLVQAGLEVARANLERDASYQGEVWNPAMQELDADSGRVEISVTSDPNTQEKRIVQIQADYPAQGAGRTRASSTFTLTLPRPMKNEDAP